MHWRFLGLVTLALVASGCGQTTTRPSAHAEGSTVALTKPKVTTQATARQHCRHRLTVARSDSSLVLHVQRTVLARRQPNLASRAIADIDAHNRFNLPTVLSAFEQINGSTCQAVWFHAKLPREPNGISGWIPANAVTVTRSDARILVDLSARRIDVFKRGHRIWRLRAGIGAPGSPTPVGWFYIDAHWHVGNTAGPYGPAVLAIAAYSQVRAGRWEHGLPSAIHGTNAPWTIGGAASHGCLHVPNESLARLLRLIPDGTPIQIVA